METKHTPGIGKVLLPAAAGGLLALPAGGLTAGGLAALPAQLGQWLRQLSLSGNAGNAAAWALVLALAALPALGLLWRGGGKRNWLLALAGIILFCGLLGQVNPGTLGAVPDAPAAQLWALVWPGTAGAVVLVWAALRLLAVLQASPAPGRTLSTLLRWTGGGWPSLQPSAGC